MVRFSILPIKVQGSIPAPSILLGVKGVGGVSAALACNEPLGGDPVRGAT